VQPDGRATGPKPRAEDPPGTAPLCQRAEGTGQLASSIPTINMQYTHRVQRRRQPDSDGMKAQFPISPLNRPIAAFFFGLVGEDAGRTRQGHCRTRQRNVQASSSRVGSGSCCILASLTPVFGSKSVRQSKFSSIKKKIVHRPLCANDTAVSLDRDYTSEIGQYIATFEEVTELNSAIVVLDGGSDCRTLWRKTSGVY